MNYLQRLQQRFRDQYPAFRQGQRDLIQQTLDDIQDDADALGLPIEVNAAFVNALLKIFAVLSVAGAAMLNLDLSTPLSHIEREFLWFFTVGSALLVVTLYFMEKFAIEKEVPHDRKSE